MASRPPPTAYYDCYNADDSYEALKYPFPRPTFPVERVPRNIRQEFFKDDGGHLYFRISGDVLGKRVYCQHIFRDAELVEANDAAVDEMIQYAVKQFFQVADAAFEKEYPSVQHQECGYSSQNIYSCHQ